MVKAQAALAILLVLPAGASGPQGGPQPGQPAEWTAPAEERQRVNPLSGSPDAAKRGAVLYRRHCASCHRENGKGKKVHTRPGAPQPKDLTDPALQARLTDGEIFWKLSTGRRLEGREYMPDFAGQIPSEEKRWAIVQFVRSLAAEAR